MEIEAKEVNVTEVTSTIEVLDSGIESDVDILAFCCYATMLPIWRF